MNTWKLTSSGLFILTVLSTTLALHVEIQKPLYEVARGDEVTLVCTFRPGKPDYKLLIISWTGDPDVSTDPAITFGTFYWPNGILDIPPQYEGKASMENDITNGETRLTFRPATLKESRVIHCSVQIPGDDEGQTSDTTTLVVLVAPTKPICKVQGTAEYGNNIDLTCLSEEGSPTPTYQWQSYNIKNVQRSYPPKTTEENGVLSLFNVSMETSGYFICTSTNKIGFESCNMTLTVMPPSMNIASTAVIIAACVAGVVVLVIVVYCCCCRRKKKPEEHAVSTTHVVEFQDKPPLEKAVGDHGNRGKGGVEGSTDRLDRYEERGEKDSDPHNSSDDARDRNDNRRVDYDDHQDQNADRRDDRNGRRERDDDRGYDDRRDRYDDGRDSYDDRSDRYGDRRDRADNGRDRDDDQRERYDNHNDSYDERSYRPDDR